MSPNSSCWSQNGVRFADGGAEMKHRHDRLAGDAERQHRRGVMMADRHDVAARLIDAAVNDALGIERHLGGLHRRGNRACIRGYHPARPEAASASARGDNGSDRPDGAR